MLVCTVLLGDLISRTANAGHIPDKGNCFICRLVDALYNWAEHERTEDHTVERFLQARPGFRTDVTRLLLITQPSEEEA